MTNRDSIALQLATRIEDGAQWIHLLPAGVIRTQDGRGPYRVADPRELIDASLLDAGGKLAVDENHAIDLAAPNGGPSPAVGWIIDMQSRADGIWGRVEWNAVGRQLLTDKAYRGVSPVFVHNERGIISRVLRASLVNNPNLRELVALHQENTMDQLSELRALLELPDNADASAVTGKVRELLTTARQAVDPSRFVPIGDFERAVSEVNRLNKGISLQSASDHVSNQVNAGRLPPFLKDWAIALCSVNKAAFDAFMERTGGKVYATLFGRSPTRGLPPGGDGASDLSSEEIAIASALGVSPEAFNKTKIARCAQEK
jgi:phage I-like protein